MTAPDEDFNLGEARDLRWRAQMRAAQDGDKAAYAGLLTEILPVLRAFVRRKWRSPQDVDDIVQEILLSLHSVRHTYDPGRPFLPWLLTIAYRRVSDITRRTTRRSSFESTVDDMPETFSESGANNNEDAPDQYAKVERSIAELTSAQREAILLTKVEGLSLQEASIVTGKSIASLKSQIHRAMRALRRSLTKKF